MSEKFGNSAAAMRCSAVRIGVAAILALVVAGCAGTDPMETAALAKAPIAAGKARVVITRTSALQYAAAPATITLNNQKVASVANDSSAVVDIPAGANTLAASAWSYPGEYKVKLNAVAGQTYRLEVAPRAASLGPSILLGPIGGMIDASANENAGAFEMRLSGEKSAAQERRMFEQMALLGAGRQTEDDNSVDQLWAVEIIARFGGTADMVRELKANVFPIREIRYVRMDAHGKSVAVV